MRLLIALLCYEDVTNSWLFMSLARIPVYTVDCFRSSVWLFAFECSGQRSIQASPVSRTARFLTRQPRRFSDPLNSSRIRWLHPWMDPPAPSEAATLRWINMLPLVSSNQNKLFIPIRMVVLLWWEGVPIHMEIIKYYTRWGWWQFFSVNIWISGWG